MQSHLARVVHRILAYFNMEDKSPISNWEEGDDALDQDRGRAGAERGIFHLSKNKE